jgi:predicted Zn-dependent protease
MPSRSRAARRTAIFLPRASDVRIFREVLLLLALYAGVGLGVYGVWRLWPASKAEKKGNSQEDASLLDRTEGKLRDLLRREAIADASGEAAVKAGLRKVQDRLSPALGALSYPIESYVIDSSTVNAVCLPGNIILVYSGLLRRLESPEELAAILAHEIAHAVHRDPMQALKRELGLAALFAMVGGRGDGVTGRLMHRLVSSGFSRQQELAADQEALRVLAASDIDPKALADALRRIRGEKDEDPAVLQYISTHPGFDERVQLSEQASANWPGKARPLDLDWKQFRAQFRVIR